MPLTNCEINLKLALDNTHVSNQVKMLTRFEACMISNDTKVTTFKIIDTKLYITGVTLSTEDNVKLLQ